jgi:CxxC motif-containing protein
MGTINIQSEHFKLTVEVLEQNARLLETLHNRSRGGVYGVESLKSGVSVIAGAVQIFTGKSDTSTVFSVMTNAYTAFQKWRTMWEEVKELDWEDALELGKHVASQLLPFVGGLFGGKDVHGYGARFAVLAEYEEMQNTRSVEGFTEEQYVTMGQLMYSHVFPQFVGDVEVA